LGAFDLWHFYIIEVQLNRSPLQDRAMAFNWFRRQYTQPEDSSEPTVEQTEPAIEAEPEENSEAEAVQEDYLAWAKAAYQNIQERQQPTGVAVPEAPETNVAQTSSVDLEIDPEVENTPDSSSNIIEPMAVDVEVAQMPTVVSAEATVPEPTSAAATSALPAWARAEADRKDRLERLKAAAIETETAAAVPSSSTTVPAFSVQPIAPVSLPDPSTAAEADGAIAFDDGFLWSAEVLASQGRRPEDISIDEITWLQKLRQGLGKTRRGFVNQLKAIVGQGPLNQDAVMELESLLLLADVGVEATDAIIAALQAKMREETLPPDAAIAYLKTILRDILDAPIQSQYSPVFAPEKDTLNIWLMTGINGAGKTTTIGKIAHVATESGFSCLVAAADTFRAAAVQQVKVWAERSNVEVIANPGQNTDPAAVVFDAIAAAQSRSTELLLVDTAGRLQNKKNLMDELRKVRQIIDKKAPHAKIESLLVLDATLGQNGLRQAQVFSEAAQLSGVVLTKLDGTAKGGVALAVVQQLGLPIRFIGAGEGIKDLRPFSSYEFVEALLSQ
jgi:fused signal recognition particle receptor